MKTHGIKSTPHHYSRTLTVHHLFQFFRKKASTYTLSESEIVSEKQSWPNLLAIQETGAGLKTLTKSTTFWKAWYVLLVVWLPFCFFVFFLSCPCIDYQSLKALFSYSRVSVSLPLIIILQKKKKKQKDRGLPITADRQNLWTRLKWNSGPWAREIRLDDWRPWKKSPLTLGEFSRGWMLLTGAIGRKNDQFLFS